jgi:hypothetical protein
MCRENPSFVKMGQEKRLLYMKTNVYFLIISRSLLLRVRYASDIRCRENQNAHFVFRFFPSKVVTFMRENRKMLQSGAGHR